MDTSPNAEQIAYWNETAGQPWALYQQQIDHAFAPVAKAALEHAAPQAGERVLDVGCGTGTTTLQLGEMVGPQGSVMGIDVSAPMLNVAQHRARAASAGNVRFIEADASNYAFEPASIDLVFSRFGVMFFDDPTAAFANIRTALTPNGRVALACWRSLPEVPFFALPSAAVLPIVGPQPKLEPEAPGPLSFGKPARVQRILEGAGFRDVHLQPLDLQLPIGSGTRREAVEFFINVGPVSRLIVDRDPSDLPKIAAALDDALAPLETPAGVLIGAGIWLVSARPA